jgi:Putative phage tail protein/Concanavalin A-like lectin/glucanases superfamily/IPT/TIG domain
MSGIGEALLISAAVSAVSAGLTYALTPTQKVESGRISDLTTPKSSYGAAIPWAWGDVRVGGNMLWSTFLEEDKTTKRQGKGAKVQTTDYSYYGSFASLLAECPFRPLTDIRRVWMNKKLVYSKIGGAETIAEGGKFAELYMRRYLGNKAQDLDPLLQNVNPIQNFSFGIPSNRGRRNDFLRAQGIDPATSAYTPAYNERAYLVFQRLPLGDFFNSLPTIEAEIVASTNCTAGQIVGDIMSLRYPPGSYDVSSISTPEFACKGFFLNSIEAAKNAIQTLQKAYFFDMVEKDGVKTFIPIDAYQDVINISPGDLAPRSGAAQAKPFDYEIIEADPTSLPSEVVVGYIDPDLNYDTNEQRSSGEYLSDRNPNPLTISLPIVMSADQAANIADRTFFLSFNQAKTYKFQLPPAYLDLEIGDLISGLFEGAGLIKVLQNRIGANLILDIEAQTYDLSFWQYKRRLDSGQITVSVANYNVDIPVAGAVTAVSRIEDGYIYEPDIDYVVNLDGSVTILSGGGIPAGTNLVISTVSFPFQSETGQGEIIPYSDTELLVLDIPFVDLDDEDYTLYLAAAGTGRWNGCSVFISTDNLRYFLLTTIKAPSIFGICTTALDESDPQSRKISVETVDNELESISQEDARLGLNLALFGNQIRLFRDAELTAPDTYELGRLTGGGLSTSLNRGTNTQDNPVPGDRFVLLKGENANLTKIKYQPEDIGQVRYFKAVSSGQTLDEVSPVIVTIQGNCQRPYPPRLGFWSHDLPGNITIEWARGNRHGNEYLADYTTLADQEYELDILNSSGGVVQSFTQIHDLKLIYSAADQINNFGAVQSTITLRIAEVTADYGRGSYLYETITPPLRYPYPKITEFSPKSASPGATITVTGSGFSTVNKAYVNNQIQQNLTIIDDQHLTFQLLSTASSGIIRLDNLGGIDNFWDYPLIVVSQPVSTPVNPFPSTGLVNYYDFNSVTSIVDKVNNYQLLPYSAPGSLVQGIRGSDDFAVQMPPNGSANTATSSQGFYSYFSGSVQARLRYWATSFSISVWFKPGQPVALTATDPQANFIIGDVLDSIDSLGSFAIWVKNNKFALKTNNTSNVKQYFSSTVSLTSGNWYNLVLVYEEASKNIKLYVNNVLEISGNTTVSMRVSANGVNVSQTQGINGVVNSTFDELAIWHVPLTAAQVAKVWNNGAGSFFDG